MDVRSLPQLRQAFLRSYEQNRCFPMVTSSGLLQIQLLVAVSGLK
jgi:hypothetical protein